jgi:polysaccharide pyruvyl transferase WcaK-like protein
VGFIRECDVVIGARYHSVVLPMLMGVPTIGIAYHPKTVGVMKMAEQSEYCFPDIDTFEADELLDRIRSLIRDRRRVRAALRASIPPLCDAVERQFDEVFSIASEERGTSAAPRRAPHTERGRHVA